MDISAIIDDIGPYLYMAAEIVGYILLTFIGSLMKEIYNTNHIPQYQFQAHRVISSTVLTSVVCWALRTHFLMEYSYGVMSLVALVLGIVGFEIFKNGSTLKGLHKMIKRLIKIGRLTIITDDEDDEPKKQIVLVHNNSIINNRVHIHDNTNDN